MDDQYLQELARKAGLATNWTDYRGVERVVSPDTLRAILAALDLHGDSDIAPEGGDFITCTAGDQIVIPGEISAGEFVLGSGERIPIVTAGQKDRGTVIQTPAIIGYHRLLVGDREILVAAAPAQAWTVADSAPGQRLWGLAAQLYSLSEGQTGFGDFGNLGTFARAVAGHGADFVAISPTHALFTSDLTRFSPYGPSTRLFLNPLYAAPDQGAGAGNPRAAGDAGLIDWADEGVRKMAALRESYAQFRTSADAGAMDAFQRFIDGGGPDLLNHARFEALDNKFRQHGLDTWHAWPGQLSDSSSDMVAALSADDPDVRFHLYLQWISDISLAGAQLAAKGAGMRLGLITDMAVGMDPHGSFAWSSPGDLLTGATIGAPPDALNEIGQGWGLTAFSPLALQRRHFQPFLSTLRRAMRHAGGIRIDHAIGLQRLWLVPDGAVPTEGTYLQYPFLDLLRLICLESYRHRAIVIGEDLGTVPRGFRETSAAFGILGMRPLLFERTPDGRFKRGTRWDREAAALTSTHDLPTIAGWWSGHDIEWRDQLFPALQSSAKEQAERTEDRKNLWQTMVADGLAAGPTPYPDDTEPVIDAVLPFVAGTASTLAIITIEDLLGLPEQPNIPGTIDTHPNWRRRLPAGNGLDQPQVRRRLQSIARARSRA